MSLSKIHVPQKKVLVIPRKWWLCPDMTKNVFTGMLSKTKRNVFVHTCILCRRVVSLSKIHVPQKKVLVIPRKWWLCPDMTKMCLLGC